MHGEFWEIFDWFRLLKCFELFGLKAEESCRSIDLSRLEFEPFTLMNELPCMLMPLLDETLKNFFESFSLELDKLIESRTPLPRFTLEFIC